MSLKTALRETYEGFKSLLTGMRITAREASRPIITVQYPHETLKMPERFRGHVQLILDPVTGKSRCTACGLCVRACPSDCLEVDGAKREGEKKKSVTEYYLDFTKCSLCGSCVESCPSDAIEYSKDYNVVSRNREDFARMDLVQKLEAEARDWARTHPAAPAPVGGADSAQPKPPAPAGAQPPPTAAAPAPAPAPAVASSPTPTNPPTSSAAAPGPAPRTPESKTT